jgi:sugar lactone lactonase YvrE
MEMNATSGCGSLYRVGRGFSVQTMVTDVSCSNGIGWSPDGAVMYYIDSPTGRVDMFDFEASLGEVSHRRPFVEIDPTEGVPDGLCVDALGNVWVALWGGRQVRRYSPRGRLDDVVTVPVRLPTSCCFGGADMGDLFITTASIGSDREDIARGAGDVFVCRPGVTGTAPTRFVES